MTPPRKLDLRILARVALLFAHDLGEMLAELTAGTRLDAVMPWLHGAGLAVACVLLLRRDSASRLRRLFEQCVRALLLAALLATAADRRPDRPRPELFVPDHAPPDHSSTCSSVAFK